ncbi:uncharacterized protein PV09_08550 [Verruconis gallopava]|uniref:Centrosomin N-terminal motif 1 domain-containing protein n=1 Tax=Verruconis gallopava TaxID=253628 RepID=A0A0D1YGF9_9PEZI|nr:uncharacterized protein PV09_08550 [Verruconis gallopava]KIV99886.1 hypothetical protein PV09_08550 [Verruconis gallopava]
MAHFVETPRTDAVDRTRFTMLDLSEMPSFQAPAGKDDLLKAVRSSQNTSRHAIATPSARVPLAGRSRNAQAKNEFTPLLHSATKNRMAMRGMNEKENAGLATPAALRPGFQLSSPNMPEASTLGDSSVMSDHTPVPEVNSSSFENSTPMALPKGQLDSGNVLTLREQEARLEKIDKENFGLKLKIHFLEENLKKTGTEWSQQALRENTELKVTQMTMEHELKKYRKQLLQAERDLQAYKQQLQEHAEKVQKRHADEALKAEVDRLRQALEDRERQLAEMQLRLESAENTMQSMSEQEKLRDQIEELEAEIQARNRDIDERDDEIEFLKAQLREAENKADDDFDDKTRQLNEQLDRIEELEAELKRVSRQKDEELDAVQEEHDAAKREHIAEIEDLRRQLENAQKDKRDQLREFETRLQSYNREKTSQIEDLERKLLASEKEKADEIESLELRLKLAESKGDNQSQLAQQAAEDARQQMKLIISEKDTELDDLRAQIQSLRVVEDELEACRKQLQDATADAAKRQEEERLQEEALADLRNTVAERDRELRQLKTVASEQASTLREVERLKAIVADRDSDIENLKQTVNAQNSSLEDLRRTRIELASREQALKGAYEEAKQLKGAISDRDRQIETLRKTLEDRTSELEVLRKNNEEPHTQIEGMQSILRHRDNDLEDLRGTVNELETKLESLQVTADERLRTINELRGELEKTKQELEDEIQVLEATLDEAEDDKEKMQSRLKLLESQIEDTKEIQSKLSPMGKDLRAAQREKMRLEQQVASLERDREVADQERESLQATIEKLRRELQCAQATPKLTPSRDRQIESLRKQLDDLSAQLTLKEEKHSKEIAELQRLLRASSLDLEAANIRLQEAEKDLAELQSDSTKQLQRKAQEGREESARLITDMAALEKKHMAELKGLAKQITVLRGRYERERSFREGLGFQKQWFLMNVEMYAECNQADLKLLEDMGIKPSLSVQERRPTLKTVGLMIMFTARVKRLAGQWNEKKKMQEQLAAKLEGMRRAKTVVQQRSTRRSLPLGTR